MIPLLLGVAGAQQAVEVQTPTDLQDCLDTAACEPILTALLSETLVEMGFLFQHDGLAGSALTGKGYGLVFELAAHTNVLGSKNIAQQELPLPPILPRLEIGYQIGSYTYDDPYPQLAASVFMLPPLRVADYNGFSVGGTVSGALPVAQHYFWLGGELDLAYGRIAGPFIGNGSVIDDIDVVGDFVDVVTPPCDGTDEGCIDRFTSLTVVPRLGFSVEPHPAVFAYGKLGLGWTSNGVDVAYDASRWRSRGVQPQLGYGVGTRLGDRVQLAFGGFTALKPRQLSTDDSRAMTRLNFSFSVRTGDERYWSDEEDEVEARAPSE